MDLHQQVGGGAGEASHDVVAEDLTSSRAVVKASSSGLRDRVDGSAGEIRNDGDFCGPISEDIGDELATTLLNSSTMIVSDSICSC